MLFEANVLNAESARDKHDATSSRRNALCLADA